MLRPTPKTYPGIRIQNAVVGEVGFDHAAFMKLFMYKSQHALSEIKFSVKKLGMITIGEPETEKPETEVDYVALNRCGVLEPPVSNTPYLLNNRKMFLQTVRESVKKFKPRKDITCDNMRDTFELLPHQKLVSQYLSIDTPYRGLLLYHGLGSGKTCSAIAIAETLKPYKNIVVMTPKSLEMNFVQELKKCGDPLYAIHQKWEWATPTKEQLTERCLSEPIRHGGKSGLWINGSGTEYADLSLVNQKSVQAQIDLMIHSKYSFIIYNSKNLNKYIPPNQNPFSNNVVIIDEAHNFVSRIVNALSKDPNMPACKMYRLMMEATNCKIVLLSGTPMINYPHEISVMFNMLRGYMNTWSCKSTLSEETIRKEFPDADMIYRTGDMVHITHSPHGFVRADLSTPKVVHTNYDTTTFEERLTDFFKDHGASLSKQQYTAFPDNRDEFNQLFVQDGKLKNKIMLECRLVGLASFFPDLSTLMPRLITPIHVHRVPMSKQQFDEYTAARMTELKSEKKSRQPNELNGNYRAASRQISNTTYPIDVRKFRPSTRVKEDGPEEGSEEDIDVKSVQTFYNALDQSDYCTHIQNYSTKFDLMVKNIQSYKGLQLVYSNFITIEGVRSFARVLDSRGFADLELVQSSGEWTIRMPEKPCPMYIIYGGGIKEDKKEILRNIYNKNWDAVPESVRVQAIKMDISVFMITSAGAEGISLKNVQYVHIMEPFWNQVRIDQVIGRARRICSHNSLPEKDRFVEVNLYLSVLPEGELPEIIKNDLVGKNPGSTDEYLYRLSQKKRDLSDDILKCIRRASIDCSLYDEDCLNLTTNDPETIAFFPDIGLDITTDKDVALNVRPTFQSISKDGVKVYLLLNPEKGLIALYQEKEISEPIGYLSEDKKTLYNKDKQKVKKLTDL
jgi:hypothetical protein